MYITLEILYKSLENKGLINKEDINRAEKDVRKDNDKLDELLKSRHD